jgi:hypothetical protein
MVGEEIVMINEAENIDKGAKIAKCAAILGLLAMLKEAEVIKIANIADVLTSRAAAELIENAVVIKAFEPQAGTSDRGGPLCSAGFHSIPGLVDSRNHHLSRSRRTLDVHNFTPASGSSIVSSTPACRCNTACRSYTTGGSYTACRYHTAYQSQRGSEHSIRRII